MFTFWKRPKRHKPAPDHAPGLLGTVFGCLLLVAFLGVPVVLLVLDWAGVIWY